MRGGMNRLIPCLIRLGAPHIQRNAGCEHTEDRQSRVVKGIRVRSQLIIQFWTHLAGAATLGTSVRAAGRRPAKRIVAKRLLKCIP